MASLMTGRPSDVADHWSVDLERNGEGWWPGRCACGADLGFFPEAEDAADALMAHALGEGHRAAADLRTLAAGFLSLYDTASTSDAEGLLQAVDPDEMRQLWHRVDEAAFDLREFLAGATK